VNDTNCPFCILHENAVLYDKFAKSSSVILEDGKRLFWTWVTGENYQQIYQALNQITKVMHYKDALAQTQTEADSEVETETEIPSEAETETESENESVEVKVDEAQIVAETESETESEEKAFDVTEDEFFSSIMSDEDNHFKFFQKYSYWSPEQLLVEIKNNVWFPAKLTSSTEERQLLNLKCPSAALLQKAGIAKGAESRGDWKKQYNKWMWQSFVKGLGNEFQYLSVFPDLNNEQTKEFYSFMEEFHQSWVPEGEAEPYDSDDDEDQGTVW